MRGLPGMNSFYCCCRLVAGVMASAVEIKGATSAVSDPEESVSNLKECNGISTVRDLQALDDVSSLASE